MAHTLQHFIEGMESVAVYLRMMGMELDPRKCAMATTEGTSGLHLRLCPNLENPWHSVPAVDSVRYQGLQLQPDGEFYWSASTSCTWQQCTTGASTPSRRPKWCSTPFSGSPEGMTQYIAPFIADNSDTARHLDHITVKVAKHRARYALNTPRDSLQDDWTQGLMRVPTRCQQGTVVLVGTLVPHRWASVRAEATSMFWEIAGEHGFCPVVHCPVPEFTTLAGGNWVNRIPRALAALEAGLHNPIECQGAADVQLQSFPGNVVMLRTTKLQHRDTCPLTVPHTTPWHGHHGPHHRFPDNDNPWPAAVRECLNQSTDEHPHH